MSRCLKPISTAVAETTSNADMAMRSHSGNDLQIRSAEASGAGALVSEFQVGSKRPISNPSTAQSGNDHHGAPIPNVIEPTKSPPAAPTELATNFTGAVRSLVISSS